MKKFDIDISVVVPCFNEGESLNELISQVVTVCEENSLSYELILIDDGSNDETWYIIEQNAPSNAKIKGIKLSRNHGHQIALTAGLSQAEGNLILMMDADLQDPPQLLPEMIKAINEGAEVAYGVRKSRSGETYFKKLTAKVFYKLINYLSSNTIPRDTGDFRLITKRALETFLTMDEQFRFVRGMFSWIGFKQTAVFYHRNPRVAGETKYTIKKMVFFALDAVTSFSIAPIRFAVYLSLFSIFIAILTAAYVIISLISFSAVPGWASMLLIFSFFSSVQLIALGIIGEYIGRMFVEIKKRPLFIVEKTIGKS